MPSELKERIRDYMLSEEGLAKVLELSRSGCTQEEIAREFGITRQTLFHWSKANTQLREAILEGKKVADERVEDSLYEQCFDRPFVEETTEYDNEGRVVKRVVKKKVNPASVNAIQYWLANRSEGKWKARQQLELVGDATRPVVFINDVPKPDLDLGMESVEGMEIIAYEEDSPFEDTEE